MVTLKTIKSWFYPVTPLTIVTPVSIVIAIHAIYLGLTLDSPAIIYPMIIVPITAFIVVLYILDRILIKKGFSFYILMITELVLITGFYLLFSYADSTTDIRITTDEDYIFVLYDAHENSLDRFEKKGIFSKELLISGNIVHLDSSLLSRDDIRIFPPDSWMGIYEDRGIYFYKGDTIPYTYKLRGLQANEYARTQQAYIDSLLALALQHK
jgi:hypothetical protein